MRWHNVPLPRLIFNQSTQDPPSMTIDKNHHPYAMSTIENPTTKSNLGMQRIPLLKAPPQKTIEFETHYTAQYIKHLTEKPTIPSTKNLPTWKPTTHES